MAPEQIVGRDALICGSPRHGSRACPVLHPQTHHEIREQINAQAATDDETLRQILKLLCNDNYLTRTEENTYQFYLILIRRWWRLNRSL